MSSRGLLRHASTMARGTAISAPTSSAASVCKQLMMAHSTSSRSFTTTTTTSSFLAATGGLRGGVMLHSATAQQRLRCSVLLHAAPSQLRLSSSGTATASSASATAATTETPTSAAGAASSAAAVPTTSQSTAMEAAIRITSPGVEHPATGLPTAVAPSEECPEVHWREHWDLELKRPYYHNLATNDVIWQKPEGFTSRFGYYYARIHEEYNLGHRTEEHTTNPPPGVPRTPVALRAKPSAAKKTPTEGYDDATAKATTDTPAANAEPTTTTATEGATNADAAAAATGVEAEAAAAAAATAAKTAANRSLKDRIKDYGAAGIFLYLTIHFTSLGIVFLVMYNGVDLTILARSLGFDIQPSKTGNMAALWVAAIAVNKIFGPLQVLTALALAPRCVPVIRRVLSRVYSHNK